MKKLLIIVCCMALAGFAHSQSDTLNRTDKFGKKYGYWKVYDQKRLVYEGRFLNGEPVGKMIHYYPNGKTKDISFYTINSPKVTSTLFHENGTKSAEGVFINKKKDGNWKYYNASGKLISEENYANGMKNGVFRIYSAKNDVILEEVIWKNDKKEGPSYSNYSNGKIRMKLNYRNDKMDGPFENYYESGKLWTKGSYREDFRDGVWITYNEAGQELVVQTINKGQTNEMLLGFNSKGQWIKLNIKAIAYFYQAPVDIMVVLKNKRSYPIQNDNLTDIARRAGAENLTFLNENVLSSYTAIKKVTPADAKDEEGIIMLKPDPNFEVICDGDYYKLLKNLINAETPKED